jgi:hypothetical protein
MARINTCSVSEYPDFVIDEIVARCSDDLYGAVKALLLVNEQLEAELNRVYDATSFGLRTEHHAKCTLH